MVFRDAQTRFQVADMTTSASEDSARRSARLARSAIASDVEAHEITPVASEQVVGTGAAPVSSTHTEQAAGAVAKRTVGFQVRRIARRAVAWRRRLAQRRLGASESPVGDRETRRDRAPASGFSSTTSTTRSTRPTTNAGWTRTTSAPSYAPSEGSIGRCTTCPRTSRPCQRWSKNSCSRFRSRNVPRPSGPRPLRLRFNNWEAASMQSNLGPPSPRRLTATEVPRSEDCALLDVRAFPQRRRQPIPRVA